MKEDEVREKRIRDEITVDAYNSGERRRMGVPLSQLEPLDVDEETKTAIEDWHYWVATGYELA